MAHLIGRLGLFVLVALGGLSAAIAQPTPMVIGTGVDPSFAAFYIGKAADIFARNGLDVVLNTGPSGSAMVPFLIRNQSQAVLAAEQAGIQNFNLDSDVVLIAETTELRTYWAVLGKNIADIEGLRGKRIGVSLGSASESFWLAVIKHYNLDPKDYAIVPVEPPEMIAALERGNIDAFVSWEPWLTKAIRGIPGTRIVQDNNGILTPRVYLYMNKSWIKANPAAAQAFLRSVMEATRMTATDRAEAARYVAAALRLDLPLTSELMDKLIFDVKLTQRSVDHMKTIAEQIAQAGKLAKPVNWNGLIFSDLMRSTFPDRVDDHLP